MPGPSLDRGWWGAPPAPGRRYLTSANPRVLITVRDNHPDPDQTTRPGPPAAIRITRPIRPDYRTPAPRVAGGTVRQHPARRPVRDLVCLDWRRAVDAQTTV